MTHKVKTSSTLLDFFRVNRFLTYIVLSMVLPSIAWPAIGGGDGPDYGASRSTPVVFHGLPVTGESLSAALAANKEEKATRVAFPARRSQRGLGSIRFSAVNPMMAGTGDGRASRSSVIGVLDAIAMGLPGTYAGAHTDSKDPSSAASLAQPPRTTPRKTPGIPRRDSARILGLQHAIILAGGVALDRDVGKKSIMATPMGGEDLETGTSPTRTPISPEDLKILKSFNNYMLEEFSYQRTWREIAIDTATFILVGALCMELWGEGQMMVDRTLTTLRAQSVDLDHRLGFTPTGIDLKIQFSKFMLANAGIALSSYLIYRLNKFAHFCAPTVESTIAGASKYIKTFYHRRNPEEQASTSTTVPIAKKLPLIPNFVGNAVVLFGAIGNGIIPAYASYEATYLFSTAYQYYARIVPPFLLIFYTIDSLLRLHNLKTIFFNKRYVQRGSPVAQEREKIIENIGAIKQAIFRLKWRDFLRLDATMKSLSISTKTNPSSTEMGIEQYRVLTRLVNHNSSQKKKTSAKSRCRQYGPATLAALLAVPGAYLTSRAAYNNFGGTIQFLQTGQSGSSLFDAVTLNNAQVNLMFYDIEVNLWPNATANVTVYDGNMTDWCWDCLRPGGHILSDALDPTNVPVNFLACPGVSPIVMMSCNPATDFAYNEDNCWGTFEFMASYAQSNPYQSFIDQYDPHLDPGMNITSYQLPIEGQIASGIGAGLVGLGAYGLGLITFVKAVKLIIDSYRKHPEDVLPGKRNHCITTVEMSAALIQSLIRAAPILISGWLTMNNDNIDPGLMWISLGAATLTGASTFFPDFDEVYSHLPQWVLNDIPGAILKIFNTIKGKVYRMLGWPVIETKIIVAGQYLGDLVFPKRDKMLRRLNRLRETVIAADDEVIKVIKNIEGLDRRSFTPI